MSAHVDHPRDAAADQRLMSAVVAGEAEAMSQLYDRFAPLVNAIARRMMANPNQAEEVLEEVFVEIWRRGASFDPARSSVATWIAMIARSRAIDALRRDNRHSASQATEHCAVIADTASPVAQVIDAEEKARVTAALATLSTEHRQAIELAYFEMLSHSAIAERLGRPLGTIKSHLRQAMSLMQTRLRMDGEVAR